MSNPRNPEGNLVVYVVGALVGLVRDLSSSTFVPIWGAGGRRRGRRSSRGGKEVTHIQIAERFVSFTTERDLEPRRRRRRRRRNGGG